MSGEILQCLAASLSAEPNARIRAELRISELFAHPETAIALSSIVNSLDVDTSLRQMTAIVMRKYVHERWSPYFPSFKGNAPSVEIKTQVRTQIFNGLSDQNSKVRSSCAHTLSMIADCDWPEEYPDLLNSLISLLSSSSLAAVHGSMQVFSEFIKSDLTEDQILPVLRQLLPVLLTILGSSQHTFLTRARVVAVFRQCITTLYMVKEEHPQAVKEAASSILPVWIDAFKAILNLSVQQDIHSTTWDGLAIRIEVFKTLETLNTAFQKSLAPHLNDFLSIALNHLRDLLPTFDQYYLSSSPAVRSDSSEEKPVELNLVACAVIDFVNSVAHGSKSKPWLQSTENFEGLVIANIGWLQMTPADEDDWATDANAFVAQDDEVTQSAGLRSSGLSLIATLMDRSPESAVVALSKSVYRIISDSQQARETGSSGWWRPLEAALAALGSIAEDVLDFCEDAVDSSHSKGIEVEKLLTDVIPSLLPLSETPFLQGRSFVFASQYSKALPEHLAGHYIAAAIEVMEAPGAGIPIKLSAVKAINNFCSQMDNNSALVTQAERIATDLGPFLLMTNEDTLSLVLETLSSVARIGDGTWISAGLAEKLVTAMLQVWANNNKDPIVVSVIGDIFSSFASSKQAGVYQAVVNSALPTLCNAMGSAKADESWVPSTAIDLITNLQEGAPADGLGEGFFSMIAPSLFSCLRMTEDRDVLQNGVVCLTWVIRKDISQLLTWHDAEGRTGIDNVLSIIAKLLGSEDESGGLFIGDLIIHLLRRASSAVVSVLPDLLQAMVRKMVSAKTATFVQSLVIPFAFIVQSERDTVLSLLEGINVDSRSGLDILIQTWCENAEVFQGYWPSRVSTIGLCQLFASERPTLQNMLVKGDLIVQPETQDVIVTRSMAKKTPHEFTKVPFPLKALKLLITDLRSSGEAGKAAPQKGTEGADSDDEDDDWEDEEKLAKGMKEEEYAFLSDMLGPRGAIFDGDDFQDDHDDEDLKSDPISQMDMTAHLVNFLKECGDRNTNNFQALVGQLSAEEMLVIQRVLSENK